MVRIDIQPKKFKKFHIGKTKSNNRNVTRLLSNLVDFDMF